MVKLELKRGVPSLYSLEIFLSQVFRSKNNDRQCYKVSTKWKGGKGVDINFQEFRIQLALNFANGSTPGWADFVVTSEENSYGIAWKRWFDGKIGRFGGKIEGDYWAMKIIEVTEYHNMECSKDSYYKCLAKRFSSYDFSQVHQSSNGSKCQFTNICSPFPLPFSSDAVIPICSSNLDRTCYEDVLMKLKTDQGEHCKKSCHVKEFKTRCNH